MWPTGLPGLLKNASARLVVAVVLVGLSFHAVPGHCSGSRKIYTSTIGLPFFPGAANQPGGDFVLYRVGSEAAAKRLLHRIVARIELSRRNRTQFNMLARVLSVRDYAKEYVYVLCSPVARAIKIEQPFRYKGRKRLLFNVVKDPRNADEALYLRLYVVDRAKDRFAKAIVRDGRQRVLKWRQP